MSPKLAAFIARLIFILILSLALYFLLPGYESGARVVSFQGRPVVVSAASLPAQPVEMIRLKPAKVARPESLGVQLAGVIPAAQATTPAGTADTQTLTSTPSATPVPTETRSPHRATRTPRPTSTPPTIPPPQDPGTTNMMMIFGIMVVMVILFGIWLNRKNAM